MAKSFATLQWSHVNSIDFQIVYLGVYLQHVYSTDTFYWPEGWNILVLKYIGPQNITLAELTFIIIDQQLVRVEFTCFYR